MNSEIIYATERSNIGDNNAVIIDAVIVTVTIAITTILFYF
jgi:hypothetical protein